jgi:hypothetical protein
MAQIASCTYATSEAARCPVSLEDPEQLRQTATLTDEDVHKLYHENFLSTDRIALPNRRRS